MIDITHLPSSSPGFSAVTAPRPGRLVDGCLSLERPCNPGPSLRSSSSEEGAAKEPRVAQRPVLVCLLAPLLCEDSTSRQGEAHRDALQPRSPTCHHLPSQPTGQVASRASASGRPATRRAARGRNLVSASMRLYCC